MMYVNVTHAQFAWLQKECNKGLTSARVASIRDNMVKWSRENGGNYDPDRAARERLATDIRIIT